MTNNRKRTLICVAICLAMLAGSAALGPAQEGVGERIGARLDRLGEELREGWARARSNIEQMGVQGRVYGRLRWDKALSGADVDVDVREGHTVVLKGTVPSAAAKSKAVELAENTVGVESVVDQLRVLKPIE